MKLKGITTANMKFNIDSLLTITNQSKINSIDCSITNIIQKPWEQIQTSDVLSLKETLEKNNITVNSLQSIFYGKPWNFGEKESHTMIINHMKHLIKYQKILGTKKLLFGSEKQRIINNNLVHHENILKEINSICSDNDVVFNIENIVSKEEIFGQSLKDIFCFISQNKLTNIKINLHVFLDDNEIELPDKKILELVDSLHISYKNMECSWKPIKESTMEKIRFLFSNTNIIILEANFIHVNNVVDFFERIVF